MVRHQLLHIKKATAVPWGPSFLHSLKINYLHDFFEYGAIESWGGWRIVFDATRLFFNTMWAIGFYFREDAGFASGETIKVDRVIDGSVKMCL